MAKKEVPLNTLAAYMPEGAYEPVAYFLNYHKVHLTIARGRESLLGDYRPKHQSQGHRISVNGNLNKYAFLITLLHELAHLLTFEQYANRVQAHGKEWQQVYGQVLATFLEKKIFPADIEAEILKSIRKPGASTCAEEGLQRVLHRYNPRKEHHFLVEELQQGDVFITRDGRRFQRGNKRTKRYECLEIKTGRTYLFSPVYEVMKLSSLEMPSPKG